MNLQNFIVDLVNFANGVFIPFLLGIAFLIFVFNVFRFFILGGTNEDSKQKAKSLAIYGVLAFVFIMIFWGIVNMLAGSLGLDTELIPCPDYGSVYVVSGPSGTDCFSVSENDPY